MGACRNHCLLMILLLCVVVAVSCTKKDEEEAKQEPVEEYGQKSWPQEASGEVSFGIFFDEKGETRTITLGEGQEEFKAYIIVQFPEWMEIAAVEWRLVLPEGVEVVSDQFYEKRFMLLGTFESGISERFPCITGPQLTIHTLTLRATKKLKNAELALMPGAESKFIGVAKCEPGYPLVRAASYKAVVNPQQL